MSNQIAKAIAEREQGPSALIETYRPDFTAVLPTHVKPEQWMRLSVGLLRRNRSLAAVAQANPYSLLSALLDCARKGLEPGDTYHLVPFGSEIVGIADYKGLIQLMHNSAAVKAVKSEVVRAGDLELHPDGLPRFLWEPDEMDRPRHKPDWFSDRGELIGAYAYAVMADGSISQVIVMNAAEIMQIKAVSKTSKKSDSPWNVWPDRMWRKTVIRQLAKFVPMSTERLQAWAERTDEPPRALPHANELPPVPTGALYDDGDVVDGEVVADPPADVVDATPQGVPGKTMAHLHALLSKCQVSEEERHATLGLLAQRPITSAKDLTPKEVDDAITALATCAKSTDPGRALEVYLSHIGEEATNG